MNTFGSIAGYMVCGAFLAILITAFSARLPGLYKLVLSLFSTLEGRKFKRGITHRIMSRAEVETFVPEGTWQRQVYDEYISVILNSDITFPCIYATKGYNSNEQRFIFMDSDDMSDPRHISALASALSSYLPISHSLGPNTSLVLLAKHNMNGTKNLEQYLAEFWELLDGLARLDTHAWPANIPREIDSDRWCFCFAGQPFFTVVQTPANQVRQSRHANALTIVFQPKWIFDVLFSTNAKRDGALRTVRNLLAKYDAIPVSPQLKNYGDLGSRESEQYFLLDENVPAKCPLHCLKSKG